MQVINLRYRVASQSFKTFYELIRFVLKSRIFSYCRYWYNENTLFYKRAAQNMRQKKIFELVHWEIKTCYNVQKIKFLKKIFFARSEQKPSNCGITGCNLKFWCLFVS